MSNSTESFQSLNVSKKLILKGLVVGWFSIILFLAFADVFLNHYQWVDSGPLRRLVNITRDDGLPNWFSSVQLLSIGIVIWIILYVLTYSKPRLIKRTSEKLGWGLSASFFTYLAVDDGSKLHERLGTTVRNSLEARHEHSPSFITDLFDVFPSYGWQFVFVPVFGAVALYMTYFLFKNLNSKTQRVLIFLGFSCYVASVCLDFVEGMDEEVYAVIISMFNTDVHTVSHFSKLIEELFEMVGNTFFMIAFLKHLLSLGENWSLKLAD